MEQKLKEKVKFSVDSLAKLLEYTTVSFSATEIKPNDLLNNRPSLLRLRKSKWDNYVLLRRRFTPSAELRCFSTLIDHNDIFHQNLVGVTCTLLSNNANE